MCITNTAIEAIKTALPAFLVVLGFFVNHHFALRRDKRKEQRSLLDQIITNIHKTSESAIAWHTSKTFNQETLENLLFELDRLDAKIQRTCIMQASNKKHPPQQTASVRMNIIKFRQSITLNNCEKPSFVSQTHNTTFIYNIKLCAANLETHLETQMLTHYPV